MSANADRRYGEDPLPQTVSAAAAMRRLTDLLLVQEAPHPAVDEMLARFPEWEKQLSAAAPPDSTPRLGDGGEDRRVYLQHAFDVGAYNPCFPQYRFDDIGNETASGSVTFALAFEGPPGLVHGGFLGVFFDCVTQHQSCAAGVAGKTRSLTVRYRRPTPVLTELAFDVARAETERGLTSTARLLLDGEVLCTGEVDTVASPPDRLAGSRYGRRRV
uniref:PaaI family thioesterase n=1 Tax=Mycobacterium sp. (strain JLS) TaxID=164757 RepID=A0A5Q5CEK1_MYCSJ